jgi:hypothetical protein
MNSGNILGRKTKSQYLAWLKTSICKKTLDKIENMIL